MKLAFLGLGVMGYPMAGHLQQAGHDVCVYNRTTTKAQQWVEEYSGRYAITPKAAADNAEMVFVCVGNDNDVKEVIAGEQGALQGMQPNTLLVDHTTTSDSLAKEMFELAQTKDVHFLDAPVSGGQAGAENGQLAIMIGGESDIFEQAKPILNIYAKSLMYMGGVGAGQTTKMVNQLLIAGVLQGMSEGFALARSAGLQLPDVINAISAGAAGSWQLSNRGENIYHDKFDYGFALDWMRKDLGFCLAAAKTYGLELPNAQWVDEQYALLQEKGYQRCDTSVLVKQYDD